ncbi:hypothetical protein D9M72_562970 [compost metagenome]
MSKSGTKYAKPVENTASRIIGGVAVRVSISIMRTATTNANKGLAISRRDSGREAGRPAKDKRRSNLAS